ncbi:pleiotropic regulatory protein RsmS [Vibrio hannami]|uniref:pleiotropic regulatory protein RsmS n=1 Tax=Vibrio hannami TaxID=2717094 RepID=UPI00240F9C7C|nr:pleiotropic regulatory protein RsmS [Vibrio hannami]MDG3087676.1 pleiotropic regulatory protein RsmS [Vibrio hannami]
MTGKRNISNNNTLENAAEEIKLAVDLIYLLESNEIDPKVALDAINIVKQDLESKIEPART